MGQIKALLPNVVKYVHIIYNGLSK